MQLDSIITLLADTIGLEVNSIGSGSVRDAVNRRMVASETKDVESYYALLCISQQELCQLIEEVTIPETWFFRDEGAYTALYDVIRRQWLANDSDRVLRIASIPCSTGEEPYSIAMGLLDAGVSGTQFKIDAIDISRVSINRAREGIYTQTSFRNDNLLFRQKYFSEYNGVYVLGDAVKNCVNLYQGNVLNLPLEISSNTYNVIFCRNLLIYLNESNRNNIIAMLAQQLAPDGLLFVGHAEANIIMNIPGFKRLPYQRSFAFSYVKENAATQPAYSERKHKRRSTPNISNVKPVAFNKESVAPTAWAMQPAEVPPQGPLETGETVSELLHQAQHLADQGQYKNAEKYCKQILEQESVASEALYLLGVMRMAEADHASASDYFRKVIYLDPAHEDALFQLASIAENKGEHDRARNLRRRLAKLSNENGA